jgi:hypothetical protein
MNPNEDPALPSDSESQDDLVSKPLRRASEDPPAPSRISTSIRFLRWLELIGLESDYRGFRKQETTDAWMYIEDGEAKGPVPFSEIILKLREGQSPLDIIHESKAYDEDPKWSECVYTPAWSRAGVALAWTIGFWFMTICIGFILVRLLLPFGTVRTLGTAGYFLAGLGFAYSRTKPYLAKWSARVRNEKDEASE